MQLNITTMWREPMETSEALFARLQSEGRLRDMHENGVESRTRTFLSDEQKPLKLLPFTSGNDSAVSIYQNSDTREKGLLKIYSSQMSQRLLTEYRALTARAIGHVEIINTLLAQCEVCFDGEKYKTVCDIVPIVTEEVRHGVIGLFYPENAGWIRGETLARSSSHFEPKMHRDNMLTYNSVVDITDSAHPEFIITKRFYSVELCQFLTRAIKEALGRFNDAWQIASINTKPQLHRNLREFRLIITDMADAIASLRD